MALMVDSISLGGINRDWCDDKLCILPVTFVRLLQLQLVMC